jgi:hypothetical protein
MNDSEGLPETGAPKEVLGSMHFVLISLGKELGERYDKELTEAIGPNWVQVLSNLRRKSINPTDAQFVLSEPLRNPDSPTRACLPTGGAFYNQLEDALRVRNEWMHHEVTPVDLHHLWIGVDVIHRLATSAELRIGKLCSLVKKRTKDIIDGRYVPSATTPDQGLADELAELQAELAAARQREKSLVEEMGAAQALLDEAAQGVPDANVVVEPDPETLKQLAMAEEKLARLEFLVESLLAAREATPEPDPVSARESDVVALPGHQWDAPLPTRSTTLMGLQDDLFDPLIRTGIAAEFGSEAVNQIKKWRPLIAPGATVLINDAGQAVSYIDGVPTYLGNLAGDCQHSAGESKLSGFFIAASYTLRINGTIEDRETGDTLAQVNPGSAKKVGKKLKELIPNGGRLRVTTTGTVARYQDGEWVAVTEVLPEEWFPGQL